MEAITKLRDIGYSLNVEEGNIHYQYTGEESPDEAAASLLFQKIKENKAEAIRCLELEAEVRKALEQLTKNGFIKTWSNKIQKTVYLIQKPEDLPKAPLGEVAFTFQELRDFIARKATPEELKAAYDRKDLSVPPEPTQRRTGE